MGLQAPRLSLILTAVVFALSCFGFTLFVWQSFGGTVPFEPKGYRFHVLFGSEASQLQPNADVRISGVNVGKVISVQRRDLGADAVVQMDPDFAPVGRDTRAIIRFKTLLGETFVELSPGSKEAPRMEEGATLPRDQVAPVEQVDVVLGSFDEPTREAFKKLLDRTAKALDGRGDDLNAALGHLAPATEGVADVTEVLDRQRSALRGLVRDSGVALGAVADRGSDLRSLVRAGRDVFAATASRDRELTETVRLLPGFVEEARATLRDVDATTTLARPLLDELGPVVPLVAPALDEVALLAPDLERVLVRLGPVIDAAGPGLPALSRIVRAAGPALRVLDVAGRYLVPIADYLKLYRGDVLGWLTKLGSAVAYDSPSGQRIARLINPFDEESFVLQGRRQASNRHNAYTLPGEITRLDGTRVRAWHCRNTSNPQTIPVIGTGAPECEVQPPLEFRGLSRSFPHLEPDPDTAGG